MSENKKPQLHQSHLSTLYRCGIKFKRVVLEGEREPPTTPLIVGEATHSAVAKDLTNKIENGTLLTKEAVQDFAHDEFNRTWENRPAVFNQEEISDGIAKTKARSQDLTIALTSEYHYSIAPKLFPKAVERNWVLEAPNYPYDLSGTIDVDEEIEIDKEKGIWLPKKIINIRDTKTRKTNLGQREVEHSEQYTLYAMAKFYIDGIMPDKVIQDNLVKPTKNRAAYAISYESTRTEEDFKVIYRRFEQACRVIEKEAFTPANPTDWWCSKDFCGFAADGSCPFYNSRRTSFAIRKEKQNGSGETTINNLESALNSK